MLEQKIQTSFEKIISLAPSNTNLMISLGLQKKLIGVTEYDKNLFKEKFHPQTVTGWLNADFKKIEQLNPELILTSTFLQEKLALKLQEKGFNVKHFNVRNLTDMKKSILELGKIFDVQEKAEKLVQEFEMQLNKVKALTKNLVKKKVYCEEWNSPPMVSGNWVPELVEIAGGTPMTTSGHPSRKFEFIELKKFNPDLMILHWCGFEDKINVQEVLNRREWQELKAVKEKQVFTVNDNYLNAPDLRLIQGVKKMVKLIQGLEVI